MRLTVNELESYSPRLLPLDNSHASWFDADANTLSLYRRRSFVDEQTVHKIVQRQSPYIILKKYWQEDIVLSFNDFLVDVVVSAGGTGLRSTDIYSLSPDGRPVHRYPSPQSLKEGLEQIRQQCRIPILTCPISSSWLCAIMLLRLHPLPDGNGRAARNLAVLLLKRWDQIDHIAFPLLAEVTACRNSIAEAYRLGAHPKGIMDIVALYDGILRRSMATVKGLEQGSPEYSSESPDTDVRFVPAAKGCGVAPTILGDLSSSHQGALSDNQ